MTVPYCFISCSGSITHVSSLNHNFLYCFRFQQQQHFQQRKANRVQQMCTLYTLLIFCLWKLQFNHKHLPMARKEKTHSTREAVCSLLLRGTSKGAKSIFIFPVRQENTNWCAAAEAKKNSQGSRSKVCLSHLYTITS